jgi:isoleucyl-tRNA synthetase
MEHVFPLLYALLDPLNNTTSSRRGVSVSEPCLSAAPQTRPLSSMDRWVCSRLHSTVLQCERGFEARELSAVTAAIHSFWVHSLCDVYMVRQLAVSRRSQCASSCPTAPCGSEPLQKLGLRASASGKDV